MVARVDPKHHIRQMRSLGDRVSDGITALAGSMPFVYLHVLWFGTWIPLNLGVFGAQYMFDPFPFGLLTMVVSLEAIFLATFVMISQNRSAEKSEIRAQLDYETDLQSGKEIAILMQTLVRLAEKQGVDVRDLQDSMAEAHTIAKREADRRAR